MTTLQQQYKAIKTKYPNAILLFRTGDFYQAFNEDAAIVLQLLEELIVKTPEDDTTKGAATIPHRAVDVALAKLVKAGHRVALCEQLESPKASPPKQGITNPIDTHRASNKLV